MRQMLVDHMGSQELADLKLGELLGVDDQTEDLAERITQFWNKVEANLRDGNMRLLFVADELPRELKRLIESERTVHESRGAGSGASPICWPKR